MKRSRLGWAALSFLAVGFAGCDGGDGPGTTDTDPPKATSITVSQSSVSLTYLGETTIITARVLDQYQKTFTATVAWSSDDPSVATVTAGGQVTAVANGSTTVRATSGTLSQSVSVTVQQVASRLVVVSGDSQSGQVGTLLSSAVVVRSQDLGGSPVSGATVVFTAGGDGSVGVGEATTDASAQASTTWTLGTSPGTQILNATIPGSTLGTAQFLATAAPGPPVAAVKSSGDAQTGPVGWALSQPVSLKVTDVYGNGVPGQPVAFAVTGGGGSVTPAEATTGEDGTAEATWTLGANVGANTLSATSTGLSPVEFTATGAPARADLEPGTVVVTPPNPTILEAVEVTARVTNVGYAPSAAGTQVQLLVDGVDAGTVTLAALAIDEWTEARFQVTSLSAGSHTFRVVTDPGDALEEWDETNNSREGTADVAETTLVTAGQPVPNLSAADSVELLFTLIVPPTEPGTVEVTLSGGIGDADLYVHHGARPSHRDDYDCQSGNPDTTERCVINAAEPGIYHILIFAWDEYSGTTLLATTGGPVVPYDIELVYINHGTPEQDAVFAEAAARWMQIVPGDISDFNFALSPVPAGSCFPEQPALNDVVDDLRIYVDIIEIDGPGGTLAQAGPCALRGLGDFPIYGLMQFDSGDMTVLSGTNSLLGVVLHEMGHVLGIGSIWDRKELLQNPSLPSSPGADTYFSGPRAIAAFDAAGSGSVYTQGNKVPVANEADEGSADAHWRESVLGNELMTPRYTRGVPNPLSAITIESLADLGYQVDVTQAESFLPVYTAPGQEEDRGQAIDLGNDVRRGPILVMDPKGKAPRIIRR